MKCINCNNAGKCLLHKEQPSLIGCTSGIPERKKETWSMTKLICDVTGCIYNDGKGNCGRDEVYISDAETGNPMCEYAELGEE